MPKASKRARRDELLQAISNAGRVSSAATVMFHQAIGEQMGLNVTDHKCADILYRSGPVTAGQLADLTGLTTGAVTGIIDRLEKAGYARRERDPTDRRRVIIQPCRDPEIEDHAAALFTSLHEAMAKLVAVYTEEEMAVILDFLHRTSVIMHEETHKLRSGAKKKREG